MKRFLSALTVIFLLSLQVAFADFDYSSLKKSLNADNDLFIISEQDTRSSFITPKFFSISERSFEHKNQSSNYYSYFENDWLILDYSTVQATPIRRLWIYLSSKNAFNISSITFSFNNNICTFSNFYRPLVDITQYDNGDYLQSICLVMGNDSFKFHKAILQYMYSQDDVLYDTVMNLPKIKMTLHGTEDIEVELPNSFIIDFALADLIFSDEDYADIIKMAGAPTTFNIKTNAEVKNPDVLPLGKNGEFAIQTNGAYVYNTPSSDLSGYETTDKWMFEHDENVACIVHGYTEVATISYFPTDDNSNRSSWELIKRCIETTFGENANFFNNSINLQRNGAKLVITSVDNVGTGKVYYAYTFVILKNGIVCISANSSNNEDAIPFVTEVVESIMTKNENGPIK